MPKVMVTDKKLLANAQEYTRELKCSVLKDTVLLKDLSRVDLFSTLGLQRQISLLNKTIERRDYAGLARSIHLQQYENIDGFRIQVTGINLPEEITSNNYIAIIEHYFNGFISINKDSSEISVLSHTRDIVIPLLLSMLSDLFDAEIPPKNITLCAPQDMLTQAVSDRETLTLPNSRIFSLTEKQLHKETIDDCLHRFGYTTSYHKKNDTYVITPAYYRADALTIYDVIEDMLLPDLTKIRPSKHFSIRGARRESPQQHITSRICDGLLSFGFKEVKLPELTNSKKKSFTYSKYTLRSSLLRSLLAYETTNRHKKYPHKIFEIGNIFKEEKRRENLCILYTEERADFNVLFSMLFRVCADTLRSPISLRERNYPQYEDGASFSIIAKGKTVGTIGVVHPELKQTYKIKKPCLSAELYLSKLHDGCQKS